MRSPAGSHASGTKFCELQDSRLQREALFEAPNTCRKALLHGPTLRNARAGLSSRKIDSVTSCPWATRRAAGEVGAWSPPPSHERNNRRRRRRRRRGRREFERNTWRLSSRQFPVQHAAASRALHRRYGTVVPDPSFVLIASICEAVEAHRKSSKLILRRLNF